ncbi:MAG: NAD(+) diphosphatase [Actinomycetia bacterium]|nr:NAD(+) diphosphatase [Actinomycetes bacterium]
MTSSERRLVFSEAVHDRAVGYRGDAESLHQLWTHPQTRVLMVSRGRVLVDPVTAEPLWRPATGAPPGEQYLLGVDEAGHARFAVSLTADATADATAEPSKGLRELAATVGASESGWLCHAVALANWHATHTHCPRCGSPTEVSAAGAERRCPEDDSTHFPRVDPAVIVLVTDAQSRALLGRQEVWPDGRFSTLAGFVEPGETAEQAVRREVAEESGVVVDEVRLMATQPWPFPSSLMIGASAVAAGSQDPRPDGVELSEVRWFAREELAQSVASGAVAVPGRVSISRWLIDGWFGGDLPDDGAGWR